MNKVLKKKMFVMALMIAGTLAWMLGSTQTRMAHAQVEPQAQPSIAAVSASDSNTGVRLRLTVHVSTLRISGNASVEEPTQSFSGTLISASFARAGGMSPDRNRVVATYAGTHEPTGSAAVLEVEARLGAGPGDFVSYSIISPAIPATEGFIENDGIGGRVRGIINP